MNIASYIDHTLLKPTTTETEIRNICSEAVAHSFAAVCIPPTYVKFAKQIVADGNVQVATVIGFPFGYTTTASKLREIEEAIREGADELDLVHNLTALKNGDWSYLENEVRNCTDLAHENGKLVKVIVESGLLSDDELIRCCEVYKNCNIDFMKTSTGYAEVGATINAVHTMRQHLPESIAIKASGGIRTFAFAKELIEAGASRIGCSASVKVVEESKTA